jgi:hypothetical protein
MVTTPIQFGQTVYGSLFSRRSASAVAASEQGRAFVPIADVYALRRAYYDASQYDLLRPHGTDSRSANALPRTIRAVLQLTKPAVSWWTDNLYRGAWTSDGRASSTGKPNMVPWEDDAPDELVLAAQQGLTWGNFAERVRAYCFYGPALGDVFGEVEIDYEREKSYPVFYDPSAITHLVLNGSGDVIAYQLTIPRWDAARKQAFRWSKRVTKQVVTTFYNDAEQGFSTIEDRDGTTGLVADRGVPAETPNPFGFAPGVWVNHLHVGATHGACVIDGLYALIDELNGVQSEIDDFVMRFTRQKIIVGSNSPKEMLATMQAAVKLGATVDQADPSALRDLINLWPAPENVTVARLLENLGLGESAVHIDRLTKNIETNLPEATVEEKLSQAGDVTGPGARAIVAPVQRKLDACVPGYDHGLVKLSQMQISIQGELQRARVFGRGGLTDQQQAFAPFSLQSWDRGELASLAISSRDLVPTTLAEKAAAAMQVELLSTPFALRLAGLGDGDLYGRKPDGTPNAAPPDVGIIGERAAEQAAAAERIANGAFG